jgi:hypothetical protein
MQAWDALDRRTYPEGWDVDFYMVTERQCPDSPLVPSRTPATFSCVARTAQVA